MADIESMGVWGKGEVTKFCFPTNCSIRKRRKCGDVEQTDVSRVHDFFVRYSPVRGVLYRGRA